MRRHRPRHRPPSLLFGRKVAWPAQHDGLGRPPGCTRGPIVVSGEVAAAPASFAGAQRDSLVPIADVLLPALVGIRGVHGVPVAFADRKGTDACDRVLPAGDAGQAGGEGRIANQLGAGALSVGATSAVFAGAAHAPKVCDSALKCIGKTLRRRRSTERERWAARAQKAQRAER
jgi:hypothetical protein